MKRFIPIKTLVHITQRSIHISSKSFVLSPSYQCKDVWEGRLDQDVLKKIDIDEFSAKVSEKLELENVVSPVDMDLVANKAGHASDKMKNFIIDIYAGYRKHPSAAQMPESTPYGLIRFLLEDRRYEQLIEMLQKKLKYGLFLDEHLTNMLIDRFLEEQEYEKAAQIAFDVMLQETVGEHTLTTALMWKACYMYWKSTEHPPVAPHQDDPDDDDVRFVRVDYVTNPYYDEHFDIPHNVWKLGKSFVALTEGKNDIRSLSYRLIGWALYDKYDKALDLLQSVLDTPDQTISTEALDTLTSRLESVITSEPPAEPKPVGLQTVADYYPIITQQQKDEYLERLQDLTSKINSTEKMKEFNAEESINQELREVISQHEAECTKLHEQKLKQFEIDRNENLQKEIETIKFNMRKQALGAKLRELHVQEEKLKFFEDTKRVGRSISRLPMRQKDHYPKYIRRSGITLH